ncbi:MAG: metallophosphoesterase [Candidatus Nanoarchaeia archaeon]|nr:metallophosphoesterase [Candidatus Nanoarchaeia archaeon]MDD5587827.1 metallophosphoesterase [Candidatus Nanoarchaeia archaeon]
MKILAAGDIHGDTKLVEELAKRAVKEKVDLVVLCGDLTYAERSTENLIGPFVKKKLKVILIPGNHETFATADFLAELYDVTNLHGYFIKCKDVGLFGCGGANIGLSQLSESEIFNTLKKGYDGVKNLKKKIMVTHVHPSESVMEKFTNIFPGSKGVKKAVDIFKPDLLLCSHVHEAEGLEEKLGKTKVINVGRKGKIITI